VKGRRRRRSKQLLENLQETRGCWKLKEEALDRTMWRTHFGRGYGPDVRQSVESRKGWIYHRNFLLSYCEHFAAYMATILHRSTPGEQTDDMWKEPHNFIAPQVCQCSHLYTPNTIRIFLGNSHLHRHGRVAQSV
jgi:hypothetical protein